MPGTPIEGHFSHLNTRAGTVIYIRYKMNTLSMGTPELAGTSVMMHVTPEPSLEATAIDLIDAIPQKVFSFLLEHSSESSLPSS